MRKKYDNTLIELQWKIQKEIQYYMLCVGTKGFVDYYLLCIITCTHLYTKKIIEKCTV